MKIILVNLILRKDLESGIYELDSWLIRVDDNDKAISTVGWKEHPITYCCWWNVCY